MINSTEQLAVETMDVVKEGLRGPQVMTAARSGVIQSSIAARHPEYLIPWYALDIPESHKPLRRPLYDATKRAIDIAVSLTALVAIAPLLLGLWVLMRWLDPGPLLYVHDRVGRDGRIFRCLKIRTMVVGADRLKKRLMELNEHDDDRTFKMRRDPRITPLGRLLRKYSIDEFPQLLNVLRGDMSLVGPRPAIPEELKHYAPRDLMRLQVKPGLTCLWQVSGRSELPFSRQIDLDLQYIERRCTSYDLHLLVRTVPAVMSGRGAF